MTVGAIRPPRAVSVTAPVTADAAVTELFLTHRLQLVRLAVLLVDDLATAEDVVQESFAGLHTRWHRLRDEVAALQYVRISVINNSRSTLRRRRSARRYLAGQRAAEGYDDVRLLAAEHRHVVEALRTLTRRQREVIVLRYWLDLSEEQIADTLGISRGTVKSTASRALDLLETLLEDAR